MGYSFIYANNHCGGGSTLKTKMARILPVQKGYEYLSLSAAVRLLSHFNFYNHPIGNNRIFTEPLSTLLSTHPAILSWTGRENTLILSDDQLRTPNYRQRPS